MFLSNKTIKEYIDKGKIVVNGDIHIETKGLSLHLGDELLLPKPYQTVDSKKPEEIEYINYNLKKAPYVLRPNDFVLGSTKEIVKTDTDIITLIDGRSTYARLGMSIHICAMVLDGLPFNNESSVLEIKNNGLFNILLHPGEKVGTYLFAHLSTPIEGNKDSVYTNQTNVTPPKFI
jgi:dCTP deaminase